MTKLFFAAIAAAFLSFAPMAAFAGQTDAAANLILNLTKKSNDAGLKLTVVDFHDESLETFFGMIAKENNTDVDTIKAAFPAIAEVVLMDAETAPTAHYWFFDADGKQLADGDISKERFADFKAASDGV